MELSRCCARAKEITENANNLEWKKKKKMIDEQQEVVEVREMNVREREERCSVREKEIEEKEVKLASMEEDMDELYYVLVLKEKELNQGNQKLKELEEKLMEIGLKEKELKEKFKGIELKEKALNEKLKGVELKEREIVERYQVLEAKEKTIRDGEEKMGLREMELNVGWKKLETREKVAREKFRAWETKENQINDKSKELDLREEELNQKVKLNNDVSKKLELKEKTMNDCFKMLESKEKQIEERFKTKEKQVDDREHEIELKEKEIDRRFQELDTNEKHISDLCEQIEECYKLIEMKEKGEMELYQKQVERKTEERSEAFETKEKHIVDDRKAQESTKTLMKEKQNYEACMVEEDYTEKLSEKQIEPRLPRRRRRRQLRWQRRHLQEGPAPSPTSAVVAPPPDLVESSSIQVSQEIPHPEVPQAVCVDNSSGKIGGDIHIVCRNMDPDGVKSYLFERQMEQKLRHEELLDALKSAPDPAKLVLDVVQIYYWKYTSRVEARAAKNGCRILLKILVKLSPVIASNVTDEANVLADSWKARLKGAGNSRDNYDFLLFVAAFKIASLYDADELLSLFDIFYRGNVVYLPDDTPFLCHALGLSNKIPGIIESLVQRQKWLLALKYICVFKLESDFPPVPLLEAHLEPIGKRANDRHRDGTFESQAQAYHMELRSLHEVLHCVRKLNLEQKFPIDLLVSRIQDLENTKEDREHFSLSQMKKRGTSYCISVEHTGQQEKRPRPA